MHISIPNLDFFNFFFGTVVNLSELLEWVPSLQCFSTLLGGGGASCLVSDAVGGEADGNSQTASSGKVLTMFPATWVALWLMSL